MLVIKEECESVFLAGGLRPDGELVCLSFHSTIAWKIIFSLIYARLKNGSPSFLCGVKKLFYVTLISGRNQFRLTNIS